MANGSSRNKNNVLDSLIGDDDSEVDPSYKMFLEHLSEDGESYVFYVPDGDHGMPASVRYEEDDDISCVVAKTGVTSGRDVNINVEEMNTSIDESYAAFLSLMKIEDGTNVLSSSQHRNRCGSNAKRTGVTSGRDVHINVEEMNTSIDESYAAFLSLTKIEDGFMVVEPEPGVTFVYEQEDEGMNGPPPDNFHDQDLTCEDEIGPLPYTESSAFNVCEDDQGEPIAFSSGVPPTFDEKLDSVLSQPYDRSEYKKLLRKATDRKPVSRQRHLRSASKCYATDITGPSYLDHYPDLAKQIYSADTDEGRLNLLRKFFFWLENLSHEGAHMPWVSKGLACDPILADD
ncbi:unnamed protein product [Alopecurus aequalis]